MCGPRAAPFCSSHNHTTAIASYTFVNSAARLVLADILNIEDNLGTAAGDLGFYSEILIICAVTPWGVLSDKVSACVRGAVALGPSHS